MKVTSILPQALIPIAIILTSLGCKPTMSVGLAYARTDGKQYINTGLYNFGTFYVWDTKADTLTKVAILDQGLLSPPIDATLIKQSVASGFDISFSGDMPASTVGNSKFETAAANQVSRESSITLKNAKTKRFKKGYAILNSPQTYEFRDRIAGEFGAESDRYRFVFIEGQIEAEDAQFKVSRATNTSITVSEPSVGSVKLKVKTSGINEENYQGKNVPVLFEVSLLKLVKSPSTASTGAGFRFIADTENANRVLTKLLRGH